MSKLAKLSMTGTTITIGFVYSVEEIYIDFKINSTPVKTIKNKCQLDIDLKK